ncbi:putative 3',5'-cyclic adenosine monophosphate phosphodiesterase CpdA [Nocardia nova SH22a]|uniref:Putative 3',5'-cyclic adenosine monophosphate phosphodiesterase CpdA n=1 Tax=Nocardia nova SH22a TaxID=1415166 RepID=W5T896_9NOCA|nr:metallophosphoesterase [Nocardia nova]AHH15555.1 putative 3',5'-cyclic adenosine monophosphate phosphodiesterase CpdA [Nocardia nova SH22a]
MILLAQISDTHFDLTPRNAERVATVLGFLERLPRRPDAVLVTGDLTDSGSLAQYEQARKVLSTDLPLYVLPGNHDDRANLCEALLDVPAPEGPINQAVEVGGVTVAMLDSTIPGSGGGALGERTYAWLDRLLERTPADAPVLIALHHPPMPMFSTVVDPIRLADPERLERLVANDDRILGVLAGHMHAMGTTLFGGRPLVVAPSVASAIGGAWEVGAPGEVPIDYAPDPSVVLHAVEDGRLTTVVRTVPMGGRISVQPR